jgi:hypothetical protein
LKTRVIGRSGRAICTTALLQLAIHPQLVFVVPSYEPHTDNARQVVQFKPMLKIPVLKELKTSLVDFLAVNQNPRLRWEEPHIFDTDDVAIGL